MRFLQKAIVLFQYGVLPKPQLWAQNISYTVRIFRLIREQNTTCMPSFFVLPASSSLLLHGSHSFGLAALSVGIAIFTACMALHIAGIARALTEPLHRHLALLAATVTLGGGIWATHFVGMLGFDLGTPVRYYIGYSLLALLPALVASWLALNCSSCGGLLMAGILWQRLRLRSRDWMLPHPLP